MKIKHHPQGSSLVIALIAIVVISAAIGIAVNTTGTTARINDRSRDVIEARAAAEGALEYAYGIWKSQIKAAGAPLSTNAAKQYLGQPSFSGYAYDTSANLGPLTISATDAYGTPLTDGTAIPTPVTVSVPGYTNWYGRAYNYVATVRVVQTSSRGTPVTAGAKRRFQYIQVPLFQAMYFFQDNLEIYRPAPMIISGLIHTNSSAYLSADPGSLTIQSNVSYVGGYSENPPPYSNSWSGYIGTVSPPTYSNGGKSAQLSQVQAIEPLGQNLNNVINTTDANPNNDSLHEIIEPPNSSYTDPPEIASRRMYNKAGIILTVNGSTKTVTAQNGTTLTAAQTTAIQAAVTSKTTIYDQREGKNVDVNNINVATLTPTLNAVSGFNGVLYVQDVTPVGSTSPNPKTVRLQNGGVLPDNGLTVASQNPVYVQGDYNTGTTNNSNAVPSNQSGNPSNTDSPTVSGYTHKPAAVMADAVVLLSNGWNDNQAANQLNSRQAKSTTYNMAMLTGYVPSGYQPSGGGAQYGFSGGVVNFPRFLEDWSGDYCTYYGSMVELFTSKTFVGKWDTGNIYSPPNRCWNFDTNFLNTPPPGGVDAASYSRGSWSRF
jgi:Tfp pilus assembly protein PilX